MKEPLITFGTDGLRGRVPEELDFADAIAFGNATAAHWPAATVIGFDPRKTSPQLAEGVRLGFLAAHLGKHLGNGLSQVDISQTSDLCLWLGVAPTPAVAHLARARNATGIVITASHNLNPDNGIKVFDPTGLKPSEEDEAGLSAQMAEAHTSGLVAKIISEYSEYLDRETSAPPSSSTASLYSLYIDALCDSLPEGSLRGSKVVADCANGAMSVVVPETLRRLGVDFTLLNASSDGTNINQNCGSTAPSAMAAATRQLRADLGFAFDGDGDRVIVALPDGTILDGDDMLGLLTHYYLKRNELAENKVVITPMTNLGLKLKLEQWGVSTVEVPVGDRNVQRSLSEGGWSLGGEQSGHIILSQHANTGDGLLTALHVLNIILHSPDAWPVFERVPQILTNLETNRDPQHLALEMSSKVEELLAANDGEMKIVVRASGTERLLRIMVEAHSKNMLDDTLVELVQLARSLDN